MKAYKVGVFARCTGDLIMDEYYHSEEQAKLAMSKHGYAFKYYGYVDIQIDLSRRGICYYMGAWLE